MKLDETDPQTNTNKLKNKIHHNVSYRLWKLQLKNEQCELMKAKYNTNSFHILVRCKLDGCEVIIMKGLRKFIFNKTLVKIRQFLNKK